MSSEQCSTVIREDSKEYLMWEIISLLLAPDVGGFRACLQLKSWVAQQSRISANFSLKCWKADGYFSMFIMVYKNFISGLWILTLARGTARIAIAHSLWQRATVWTWCICVQLPRLRIPINSSLRLESTIATFVLRQMWHLPLECKYSAILCLTWQPFDLGPVLCLDDME